MAIKTAETRAANTSNGSGATGLNHGPRGEENIDDLIRLAYASADFKEGMDAFLGKRALKWKGAGPNQASLITGLSWSRTQNLP